MNLYLINLLLAVAWVAVTGSFTLVNLVFGAILGALALTLTRGEFASPGRLGRPWRIMRLGLFFFGELVLSAWRVAILVTRPRMDIRPGILAYPLSAESDFQITLLANMITLTPGTLSVDVSDDRRTLYVHALDCSDPEKTRRDIAEGFERKINEAFP